MKYKVNDIVVHFRDGLCTIVSSTSIGGMECFLIKPNKENSDNVYVPIDTADQVIRNVLTIEEADKLIERIKTIEKEFNPNTKQRRDIYKKMITSGNLDDVIYLYCQKIQYDRGNEEFKFGTVDLEMLETSTSRFLDELSLIYKIERDKIEKFVDNKIGDF